VSAVIEAGLMIKYARAGLDGEPSPGSGAPGEEETSPALVY
jgi:hypothetical protein